MGIEFFGVGEMFGEPVGNVGRDHEIGPDLEKFDPHRATPEHLFALIPFGGGKRKCVGNAFAFLQVKSILTALLSRYELSLVDPPETYREVMPSLILRPSDPCNLRYTRRKLSDEDRC